MGADVDTVDLFETARVGPPRTGAPAPDVPVFPVPGWERYQPVRFLGQGGMGRVFLARDPRLHREVAIKLVRGDDPDLSRRLVAEARAQARVHHDRVCKVHEVGEVSGHVYIAMQHIPGQPLGALAGELNTAEKTLVIREAALGVHEAHRAGIIHRDIKPSNILVERAEDGSLRPCLVDFGLARSLPDGATATAAAVGTPHYMSPEQARGDTRALDRRADVYSLGATLYHVLSGVPPIDGENTLDILSRIATVEPRPLRAIDPGIPADLEAIARKCLEKDRSLRYDSARALAEDLDRYLNGEPVRARPSDTLYRLRKWLFRHRRLAISASAALAAIGVAVGFGIEARLEAAERERQAQRFTEIVEGIEATALYSALSPVHDVRPDRLALRAQMDDLATEIQRSGSPSTGPGNYALGRGYLALGDAARAREHLELAWSHGDHEPRVAYALAIVLGDLYQSARLDAERQVDKAQREARKREVERKYRDPALAYLKQAEGARVPSPHYLSARLASYEDRLDDALRELDAMGDGLPWFYEGPALRGSLLATRASRRWNAGDRAGATADFEAGRRAYERATAVAESVPSVWVASAQLEYGSILMEVYSEGEVESAHERGMAAVNRALSADAGDLDALILGARLLRRMAEHQGSRGTVDEVRLRAAVELAERAIAVAPDNPVARSTLGVIHWQWGQLLSQAGRDPRPLLQKAEDAWSAVAAADRDAEYHLDVGLTHDTWADYLEQSGGDPLPERAKAIDAYRASVELPDAAPSTWINLGNAYLLRAAHPRCKDPKGDLEQALTTLADAVAKTPDHAVAHFYLGEARSLLAQRTRAAGGDPRPIWDLAVAEYEKAIAINPGHAFFHNGMGNAFQEQARDAWDRGQSPAPSLGSARAAFERVVALAPDLSLGPNNVADVAIQEVEYRLLQAEDPRPAAALAMPLLQKAAELWPDGAPPLANLGKVHVLLARYEQERGRDPERLLSLAFSALAKALAHNPEERTALLFVAEARMIQALHRSGIRAYAAGVARAAPGGKVAVAPEWDQADAAYEAAERAIPDDQGIKLAHGHFLGARAGVEIAAGRDGQASLKRGLSLAEDVLKARPGWAEARVLRGSLRSIEAEAHAGEGEEQRSLARQAFEDFEAGLSDNGHLARRWGERMAAAKALRDSGL